MKEESEVVSYLTAFINIVEQVTCQEKIERLEIRACAGHSSNRIIK